MAEDLFVNDELTVAGNELRETFTSSGGPGGQHANRSSTRVELRLDLVASESLSGSQRRIIVGRLGAEVRVVADDYRSQARNREVARKRLAAKLAESLVRQKARRKTKPSRGSDRRRLDKKKQRSETKKQRRKPTDY